MLNKIIKILIYLAIFLLPIFVLPVTILPLIWNKQILLLVLGFITLILWLVNVIKSGELKLNWTKLSTAVLILLAVLGISTMFSSAKAHSFWSAVSAESYLHFILYGIIFWLVSNVFSKSKDIIKALILLLISGSIVNLLFLIQLFFGSVLPWEFTQAAGFNLIGSIWSLAVFLGGLAVILISLLGSSAIFKNKYYQTLGYLALLLLLISLIITDFQVVWLGLSLSMIIVIWQKLKEYSPAKEPSIDTVNLEQKSFNSESNGDLDQSLDKAPSAKLSPADPSKVEFDKVKKIDLKPVYLPAIIFTLAVVLIVIKLPLAANFQLPNLITLNNKNTDSIIADTFNESLKNTLIGSGPATFEYQYSLHQPASIIQGPFWQTRFVQGKYVLGTFLVEFGLLGLIAFLLLILFFLQPAFKKVILAKNENNRAASFYLQSTILVAGFYFLFNWFLYSADFILFFIVFVILGLWLASSNHKRKNIIFTKSPQPAFFIMLIGVLVIAGLVIGLYYSGKKYIAAINYHQTIKSVETEDFNIDSAILSLTKASDLDTSSDLYLRELTEAYLLKANQIQINQSLTLAEKQSATQLIINQLDAVITSMTAINPRNSQNWEQAGKVYSNLSALTPTAYQVAINNYLRAKELNPLNPVILYNLANVNFNLATNIYTQSIQAGVAEADKNRLQELAITELKSALNNLDSAIKLKNNYTSAYYLKAVVYEFSGQDNLALENYGIILQLEPENEDIINKIKKIKEKMQL